MGMGLISTIQVSKGVVTAGIVMGLAATIASLAIPVKLFGEARRASALTSASTPLTAATPAGFTDDGEGVRSTPYGPLTAIDRDFVRRVKLAGLWEGPAGQQAQQTSRTAQVKVAGEHMVDGHNSLNVADALAAQLLKVDRMPTEPTSEQKDWLAQIRSAPADRFDPLFVNLTREAHGKVFQVLAYTRAHTQNSQVRQLAEVADKTVRDHMDMLEKTQLWKPAEEAK
ncbi:DUF4142 domain-containing protein [Kitasatospora sp. NPDC057904]|uniref:DUF4142 domain-containing protein n=1 Tax=unclassified Kitasatospora TaxID=2633591 RepID=UPI0036DEF97B